MGTGNVRPQLIHGAADRDLLRVVLRGDEGSEREAWIEQMRETLYHEFTHHMESLAGEKMLEEKDEQQIREYLQR